jgi:hypothetical protein
VKGITINTVKGAESLNQTSSNASPDSDAMKEVDDVATITIEESSTVANNLSNYFNMTLMECVSSVEMRLMYLMFFGAQVSRRTEKHVNR